MQQTIDQFFTKTQAQCNEYIKNTIKEKVIVKQLEGGKRLRQILALLVYKACCNGNDSSQKFEKAMQGAVSMELAHSSSQVHDDIIDDSSNRRGRKSLYLEKNYQNAILIGHKMLARGFNIAINHGSKYAEIYVDAWNDALEGVAQEIAFEKKLNDLSKIKSSSKIYSRYMEIIDKKTAGIFSASCMLGGIETNLDLKTVNLLKEFGMHVGRAYQLADDLIDIKKGETAKSILVPLSIKINKFDELKKEKKLEKFVRNNFTEIKNFYEEEIKKYIILAEELIKKIKLEDQIYKELLSKAPSHLLKIKLAEN